MEYIGRHYSEKDVKQYKVTSATGDVCFIKSTNIQIENGKTTMFNQGKISAIIPDGYLVVLYEM